MVRKVIRDYMEGGGKKLTVPGFGTFMRRDGAEVIFVDLLRGDDHLLSEMVEDRGGYSEIEAMALIDRFIFETKNAIERHGRAVIEDFGTMTLDHKGVYQFNYSPKARPVKEHVVQERLFNEKPEVLQKSVPPGQPSHKPSVLSEPTSQNMPKGRTPQKPGRRLVGQKPQGKLLRADTILIVAIVAAVVALIALAFGMSSGNMPFMQK